MKILFCDIDGVLIPGRAYFMAGQSYPIQQVFDPCVVGMVNRLCKEFGYRVVVHSNWRNTEARRTRLSECTLTQHFVQQGILAEHMHPDSLCPRVGVQNNRWSDICGWLDAHPEVGHEDFWVLEDTLHPEDWPYADRVVQTDFDEGLTVAQYMDIRLRSGGGRLLLPSEGGC